MNDQNHSQNDGQNNSQHPPHGEVARVDGLSGSDQADTDPAPSSWRSSTGQITPSESSSPSEPSVQQAGKQSSLNPSENGCALANDVMVGLECDPADGADDERDLATIQVGGLEVDLIFDAGDWSMVASSGKLVEVIKDALTALTAHPTCQHMLPNRQPAAPINVALLLSCDAEIAVLNNLHRGLDKPTNVLSFPHVAAADFLGTSDAGKKAALHDHEPPFLGDIVLAAATIQREADGQGKPPAAHLQHLVIHGLLHLLGFDHETEADAHEMEALEVEILASMGLTDPYGEMMEQGFENPIPPASLGKRND